MPYNKISRKIALDPDVIKRLSEALDLMKQSLQELIESVLTWWAENIKPLFDSLEWASSIKKPDTPYAKSLKIRLFDKRPIIYSFRRDRR